MSTVVTIVITLLTAALVVALAINLATAEKRLLYRPRRLYTSRDADFRRALGVLLGPPLVAGNEVTTLINGEQIFPAMRDAINAAKVSITFETFVFRDDIGKRFCNALTTAAHRGVRVHVLLDWLGSRTMAPAMLGAIREAGADVQLYHAPSWFHLGRLNNRTHRKIMVIDGEWTSVGSANFDDRSFRLNDEANLNVFSKRLAAEQIRQVDADIAQSRRMVLKRWARRSASRRFYEGLALLLRSQL